MRRLQITDDGGKGQKILLDGEDISSAIQGYSIKGHAMEMPKVELRPLVVKVNVEAETTDYEFYINPTVAELLQSIGWTPPEESS